MARSSFCITSILLLSLVVFASAHDYGYDTKPDLEKPKPEEKEKFVPTKSEYKQPKSEGKEKILPTKHEYEKPKSEEKEKSIPTKPEYKQPKYSEEKVRFLPTKPISYEQPKPEEREKVFPTKPNYEQPKPEEKEKIRPTKPDYDQQPKPEEKEKFLPTKPKNEQQYPKPKEKEKLAPKKPNYEGLVPKEEKSTPRTIAVQGLVLCKSGSKYFPIQGAVAKITCLSVHDYQEGYETTSFSVKSEASDAKGYYYATLTPARLDNQWKLKDCKAYLDYSPLETCNVPTNVNNGILGDLLSSYSILKHSNTKLFSVGPFFYSSFSEPKSSVAGGY